MPAMLRAHAAVIAFITALLIPISASSLRGLTHVITCSDTVATPFTLHVPVAGPPIVLSSTQVEFDPSGRAGELCDGLTLDTFVERRRSDRSEMIFQLTNRSEHTWQGSLKLRVDDTSIPISIGEVGAGETAAESITLRLEPESEYDISGSLLIGP